MLTVYDKAVEAISGGSNVADIREIFWTWKRNHSPQTESSVGRWFWNLVKPSEIAMQELGMIDWLPEGDRLSRHEFASKVRLRALGVVSEAWHAPRRWRRHPWLPWAPKRPSPQKISGSCPTAMAEKSSPPTHSTVSQGPRRFSPSSAPTSPIPPSGQRH